MADLKHGGSGWGCTILSSAGNIDLDLEADAGASEWLAIGPGGEGLGQLPDVVAAAAAEGTDPEWVRAVVGAVEREITAGVRRSRLLVCRGTGDWYHVTFAENRPSIQRHGLDWRRMSGHGIAGSQVAEWQGVFMCASLDDARFFVQMGARRGLVDVWAVRLDGEWLEGAPDSDGGGGEDWMICPEPISPSRLKLVEYDISKP